MIGNLEVGLAVPSGDQNGYLAKEFHSDVGADKIKDQQAIFTGLEFRFEFGFGPSILSFVGITLVKLYWLLSCGCNGKGRRHLLVPLNAFCHQVIMVTTRSHDKRRAATDKLPVRSRNTISPVSPTLKRAGVVVEIPSKRAKLKDDGAGIESTSSPIQSDGPTRPSAIENPAATANTTEPGNPKEVGPRQNQLDILPSHPSVIEHGQRASAMPDQSMEDGTTAASTKPPNLDGSSLGEPGAGGGAIRDKDPASPSRHAAAVTPALNRHKRFASEESDDLVSVPVEKPWAEKNNGSEDEDDSAAPEVVSTKSAGRITQPRPGTPTARGKKRGRAAIKKTDRGAEVVGHTTSTSLPVDGPLGRPFATNLYNQQDSEAPNFQLPPSQDVQTAAGATSASTGQDRPVSNSTLVFDQNAIRLAGPSATRSSTSHRPRTGSGSDSRSESQSSSHSGLTAPQLPHKSTGSIIQFRRRVMGRHKTTNFWANRKVKFIDAW